MLFDDEDAHDADNVEPGEQSWLLPSRDYEILPTFHDLLFVQEQDGEAFDRSRDFAAWVGDIAPQNLTVQVVENDLSDNEITARA